MHSLSGIIAMNNAEVRRQKRAVESETSRHCSYAGNPLDGIVLHSAKQRSTVFLKPGAQSSAFMVLWLGTNSDVKHDSLVESYF